MHLKLCIFNQNICKLSEIARKWIHLFLPGGLAKIEGNVEPRQDFFLLFIPHSPGPGQSVQLVPYPH